MKPVSFRVFLSHSARHPAMGVRLGLTTIGIGVAIAASAAVALPLWCLRWLRNASCGL